MDRIYSASDRNNQVLINLERIFNHVVWPLPAISPFGPRISGWNIQPGRGSPRAPTTSIPRTL